MKRHWKAIYILFFAIILVNVSAWAAVPEQINYQGYLTDSSGMPVTDPAVSMVFIIFNAATGTTPLWEESQTVDVQSGIYNVTLGDGTRNPSYGTFDATLFTTQDLWIEIETYGVTMTPRQKISSVAYAMQADQLDGYDSSDFMGPGGGTMTGTLTLPADGLVAGTDQLVLSGGNIGIGTASPGSTLDVVGNINTSGAIFMDGANVFEVDYNFNTFLGNSSGTANTSGYSNTFIGRWTGTANTEGNYNTFLGEGAGTANTTGSLNTFIGQGAGMDNEEGQCNTFIGRTAGYENTLADNNTFLGYDAGFTNTEGGNNTFLGRGAGYSNELGANNTIIGMHAGYSTTGSGNVFLGYRAGMYAVGSNRLYIDNSDTVTPLIFGDFDNDLVTINGDLNTTGELRMDGTTVLEVDGIYNTFLGRDAGQANTTETDNTFLGYRAGFANTQNQNTFIGSYAGQANTTGSANTFLGRAAGYTNTTGNGNAFIGFNAGYYNSSGGGNSFIGYTAGQANTTGDNNSFLGYEAGYTNTEGIENTFIGRGAGFSNLSGNGNVFLGCRAGRYEAGSDKLYIANSDTSTPLIHGDFSSNAVTINGALSVTGALSKGSGSFKIDHPLDPENKYLYHSFVESPDMMNIYNGNVILNADGESQVELPEWFSALNKDFRYQVTCIGGFAPVYIAEKISDNKFRIAGGEPGMEISWQVTGIRKDPYANVNRIIVEEEKTGDEQGRYLHPQAYGFSREMGIDAADKP